MDNAVPAAVTAPLGTQHVEQILDVAVEAVNDYKSIVSTDSLPSKIVKFMPTLMKAAAAVSAISEAGPEVKDLTPEELDALATKYAPLFGATGKVAIYVTEGASIAVSVFKILKAK